ncbi:MAG: hypothetical protein ACW97Z_08135 [Candidatus Hodarchaeales archaeon]|jgi:hypothetical protein
MTNEPKIESVRSVILTKAVQILVLAFLSVILSAFLAIFLGEGSIIESTISFIAILGFVEVALGAIFSLGVSEITYASKSGLNPVYGETIMRDRIRYHTTQILNGINLIFAGILLMLLGTFLS